MCAETTEALESALKDAADRYTRLRPKSLNRHHYASRAMPGGNTRSVLYFDPFPFTVSKGEGPYIWDVDGNRYIDFLGEYTAGLFGHSDQTIQRAIVQALENGLVLGAHTEVEADLADAIVRRFPNLERLRFTNSGTEANLMALGAARLWTGRSRIMVFDGAYHGGVLNFGAHTRTVNVPFDAIRATYNDIEESKALIQQQGADLAAVLVEPMLGAGGAIPGSPEFLQLLRSLTIKTGTLLIFDEVMTSRIGPTGAQGYYGITPDLTTVGKYLGGGLSFGAFGGRADIMDIFDPRRSDAVPHAGTFNNNTLSMHAGLAGLTQVFTPERAREHFKTGEELRFTLNELCTEHGVDMQFTGLGSIMNMHPQSGTISSTLDIETRCAALRHLYFLFMMEAGIYIARRGLISLSLVLNREHLEYFVLSTRRFIIQHAELLNGE